jgi:hypothetical protein
MTELANIYLHPKSLGVKPCALRLENDKSLYIPGKALPLEFNGVVRNGSDAFTLVEEIVEDSFQGKSSCILSLGEKESGKSTLLFGREMAKSIGKPKSRTEFSGDGLVFKIIEEITAKSQELEGIYEFDIKLSVFLLASNGDGYDLLGDASTRKKLKIMEEKKNLYTANGIAVVSLFGKSLDEIKSDLEKAVRNVMPIPNIFFQVKIEARDKFTNMLNSSVIVIAELNILELNNLKNHLSRSVAASARECKISHLLKRFIEKKSRIVYFISVDLEMWTKDYPFLNFVKDLIASKRIYENSSYRKPANPPPTDLLSMKKEAERLRSDYDSISKFLAKMGIREEEMYRSPTSKDSQKEIEYKMETSYYCRVRENLQKCKELLGRCQYMNSTDAITQNLSKTNSKHVEEYPRKAGMYFMSWFNLGDYTTPQKNKVSKEENELQKMIAYYSNELAENDSLAEDPILAIFTRHSDHQEESFKLRMETCDWIRRNRNSWFVDYFSQSLEN